MRPIMVPRDVHILPWFAGYAEAINAGKSLRNEDQAAFHRGVLRTRDLPNDEQYATGNFDWVDFRNTIGVRVYVPFSNCHLIILLRK